MVSWRAIAAFVMLFATAPSSHAALGNALYVPVEINGLPAGINLVSLNCYVTDANGVNVAAGNGAMAPVSGRLVETMTIPLVITRRATIVSGPATAYSCRVALTGTAPEGYPLTFWNTTALTAAGWRNLFAPREQLTYMTAAPGAVHAMEVRGTLTTGEADIIAPVATTACPCGCGATAGSPTSCAPNVSPGALTTAPGANRVQQRRTTTRPAIRVTDAPPPTIAAPTVQVTTPTFRFTGTGAFTRG